MAMLCVPAYAVFYCWWQSWPPDSGLYRWAVEAGSIRGLRDLTLLAGLACWSWPLVALCIAAGVPLPATHEDMLRLDGAGAARRLVHRARHDAPGVGLGALIVFLITFNNTTCFDLAEVFTFGNELRAASALGASPGVVLAAGLPAIIISFLGAVLVWLLVSGSGRAAARPAPAPRWMRIMTAVTWAGTFALPMMLFIMGIAAWPGAARAEGGWIGRSAGGFAARVAEFVTLYQRGITNTALLALGCGALAALVALGLAMAWQDHRRAVRTAAHIMAIGWLLAAALPATVVATAIESAYNTALLRDMFSGTPAALLLGHLASFGFVGALIGRWLAMGEPDSLADLRRLDGAQTLGGFIIALRPRIIAAVIAAAALGAVLSLGEIPLTVRLQPPGFEALAQTVLNDMHYQRPQAVMVAVASLVLLAVLASFAATMVWSLARRRAAAAAMFWLLPALVAGGCGAAPDAANPPPLPAQCAFGSAGRGPSQFSYPRCLAVDPERERVYVIDKAARIQRFDLRGRREAEWSMPESDNGKPTGLSIAPDGRVFIADTHYWRIMIFDGDGRELGRFGSYGEGPGEFIYPTDIAFAPDGRIYVSEYGGNDRVQVFSADGEWQMAFGSLGPGLGQFNRPQAMAFSRDGRELFIADSCNHRIVVTDLKGDVIRVLGAPGHGPGELAYPYGIDVLPDGTLIVCEFQNNRVQHLAADGACLAVWGGAGFDAGRLQYPWAVAAADEAVFVLDSGNNRVLAMDLP
jgi:DNA-binding beta-propeller fold protein YncE/ABC-type Fe3+ transport system permease subunit